MKSEKNVEVAVFFPMTSRRQIVWIQNKSDGIEVYVKMALDCFDLWPKQTLTS